MGFVVVFFRMEKSALESIYAKHHKDKGRYGYLFCGGARAPFLKEWIGTGKKVLDLGCRDGMLTQSFAEGNEVMGADIDQKALDLCNQRLGIETRWVDLNQEWCWNEASFDCIVACEIVEHLFFLEPFLEKAVKTLKKGGLFIGSVPNAFRLRNRWKFLWGQEYETDETHVRRFTFQKLESVLRLYFDTVEILPIGGKMLPFAQVTEKVPERLGRLFGKDLLWKAM